ncbi:type I restriction endonuclease [Gordonia sp. (in: high G+C Gram-positive bacteria)]|uniref:type I restriction endonuclease n=1 Tax=Gordonia sp. (in: high G+C Gram-positive bacteria) TaxID=84139 RepID=UPI0039E6F1C4
MATTNEQIGALARKIQSTRDSIDTEEGTKNAFIMPFISNVLGYDVFDPTEVVPEYTADVATKRGEKVDYAIFHDDNLQLLIECKPIGSTLDLRHAGQLFRYFSVTSARIAILTNGQQYQVFTDSELPNRMDEKPFLVFDLLDLDRSLLPEIQKLSKDSFDLDSVINAAQELKYVGGIRRMIADEVKDPSDDWVRYFVTRIYEGKATQKVIDQFRPLVAKALTQYLGGQVNERLKVALGDDATAESDSPQAKQPTAPPSAQAEEPAHAPDSDVVTTEEELEGYNIVRAIAVSDIPPERIAYRDGKAYFAVLLDDNNRKPIIRLHLNGQSVKYVSTFEKGKETPTRHDIESVIDIYRVSKQIRQTIRSYE